MIRRGENFSGVAGLENRETAVELPERLFRQVPLEELFLLYRDSELPLQHFRGSVNSGIEENSVGNFWFGEPVALSSIEAYVTTRPSDWRSAPEFPQASNMAFTSNVRSAKYDGWGASQPGLMCESTIEEYHTGNRVLLDELDVFLSSDAADMLKNAYSDLVADIGAGSVSGDSLYGDLVGDVQAREFMFDYAGRFDAGSSDISSEIPIIDSDSILSLKGFYEWALALPIIPKDLLPAYCDVVDEGDEARALNTSRFIGFIDSVGE